MYIYIYIYRVVHVNMHACIHAHMYMQDLSVPWRMELSKSDVIMVVLQTSDPGAQKEI